MLDDLVGIATGAARESGGEALDLVHVAGWRLSIGDPVGVDENAIAGGQRVLRHGDWRGVRETEGAARPSQPSVVVSSPGLDTRGSGWPAEANRIVRRAVSTTP